MIFDVSGAEEKIGYVFKDKTLLRQCFTHSSYANEHNEKSNERLEFLGDGIIKFIQTEYLFKTNDYAEGSLTALRQKIENDVFFLKIVKDLNLDEYVLLGKGQQALAKHNEKLFSSLIEAIVAGIYLDGGMSAAKKFVKTHLIPEYESFFKNEAELKQIKDAKSALQEYVQKNKLGTVRYDLLSKSGPEHSPVFNVAATLNGKLIAEGTGKNKKQAEKSAAEIALEKLKQDGKLL